MRLEKLPNLTQLEGVRLKVCSYIMGLFLISGIESAKAILDALKEIVAVIEMAIYREEQRELNRRR